jgi:hypothetical protein
MPHKFKIGQPVEYHPPRRIYAPRGTYLVTAKLPEQDGEFEYHIWSVSEQHERVVRESDLHAIAIDADTPSTPEPKKQRPK